MHDASLLHRAQRRTRPWRHLSLVNSTIPCNAQSPRRLPQGCLSVPSDMESLVAEPLCCRVWHCEFVVVCGTSDTATRQIKARRQPKWGGRCTSAFVDDQSLERYAQSNQAASRMSKSLRDVRGGYRCMHASECEYDMTQGCHCERLRGFSVGGGVVLLFLLTTTAMRGDY
jgi:hypothetical protein